MLKFKEIFRVNNVEVLIPVKSYKCHYATATKVREVTSEWGDHIA